VIPLSELVPYLYFVTALRCWRLHRLYGALFLHHVYNCPALGLVKILYIFPATLSQHTCAPMCLPPPSFSHPREKLDFMILVPAVLHNDLTFWPCAFSVLIPLFLRLFSAIFFPPPQAHWSSVQVCSRSLILFRERTRCFALRQSLIHPFFFAFIPPRPKMFIAARVAFLDATVLLPPLPIRHPLFLKIPLSQIMRCRSGPDSPANNQGHSGYMCFPSDFVRPKSSYRQPCPCVGPSTWSVPEVPYMKKVHPLRCLRYLILP